MVCTLFTPLYERGYIASECHLNPPLNVCGSVRSDSNKYLAERSVTADGTKGVEPGPEIAGNGGHGRNHIGGADSRDG